MPASPTPLRRLAGALVAVLLIAGCQSISDANQVIGRADLVNDLASRLDRSSKLTYTAQYRLTEGRTASIVQAGKPPRAAYLYPGGKLMVDAKSTTECDTTKAPSTCTRTLPPSPSNRPTIAIFKKANEQGLVTPPVVINLLTAAALDAGTAIEQRDTTIAGRHATCVQVSGITNAAATQFDACITTEGVLGSFSGVVDGTPVELVLAEYRGAVDATAFALPGDADVIDQRPSTA